MRCLFRRRFRLWNGHEFDRVSVPAGEANRTHEAAKKGDLSRGKALGTLGSFCSHFCRASKDIVPYMKGFRQEELREPRFARVGNIVKEFGLSPNFWRKMADQGEVVAKKKNGQRVFDRASCAALLDDGASPFSPQPRQALLSQRFRDRNDGFRRKLHVQQKR